MELGSIEHLIEDYLHPRLEDCREEYADVVAVMQAAGLTREEAEKVAFAIDAADRVAFAWTLGGSVVRLVTGTSLSADGKATGERWGQVMRIAEARRALAGRIARYVAVAERNMGGLSSETVKAIRGDIAALEAAQIEWPYFLENTYTTPDLPPQHIRLYLAAHLASDREDSLDCVREHYGLLRVGDYRRQLRRWEKRYPAFVSLVRAIITRT